jgi:hypothetical protein
LIENLDGTNVVNQLSSLYRRVNNRNQKRQVTLSYIELLSELGEKEQKIYHSNLIETIKFAPASFLTQLTDILIENYQSSYNFDELLGFITQRSTQHADNETLRKSLFELSNKAESRVYIENYVSELWGKHQGFSAVADAKEYLRAEEFRGLVVNLIDKSDHIPTDMLESAFEVLGEHSDRYTIKFSKNLTEEILNDWMQKPNLESRKAGLILWRSIREKAQQQREKFYSRLIEYAQSAINDDTIVQAKNRFYIETLVNEFEYLSTDNKNSLIELCLRLTETGKQKNVKLLGYEILSHFSSYEHAQLLLPVELIDDLEKTNDKEEMDAILKTLNKYKGSFENDLFFQVEGILKEKSGLYSEGLAKIFFEGHEM